MYWLQCALHIYLHCNYEPRLHLNAPPKPTGSTPRRTDAADREDTTIWRFLAELHTILIMETYCHSFMITGAKTCNSFPNETGRVSSAEGLQGSRIKKAAHHQLLRGTQGWEINAGLASDVQILKSELKNHYA